MFSKYKYLNVNFFFSPRFWSGNFFLIAPFPDHCLLIPFSKLQDGNANNGIYTERKSLTHCIVMHYSSCFAI